MVKVVLFYMYSIFFLIVTSKIISLLLVLFISLQLSFVCDFSGFFFVFFFFNYQVGLKRNSQAYNALVCNIS